MKQLHAIVMALALWGCGGSGDDSSAKTNPHSAVPSGSDTASSSTTGPGTTSTTTSTTTTSTTTGRLPTDTGTPVPEVCPDFSLVKTQSWVMTDLEIEEGLEPGSLGTPPGLAMLDFDHDGDLDVLITHVRGHTRFMQNDGSGFVTEVPTDVDGDLMPGARGLAASDLDGNGFVDLVMSQQKGVPDAVVWQRSLGEFEIEVLPNSTGASKSVALGDPDGDGDLDIITSGHHNEGYSTEQIFSGLLTGDGGQLFMQEGSFFVERTSRIADPEALDGFTFMTAFSDIDDDGYADLYVVNDWGPHIRPNALLLFDPVERRFKEHTTCNCNLEMHGMGVAVGDANGDHLPDLFITDTGRNLMFVNQPFSPGVFVESRASMGLRPARGEKLAELSWGTSWVDFDQDGWDDLVVQYGSLDPLETASVPNQPDVIFHADGDGTFTDVSDAVGFTDPMRSRTLTVGDLDGDGRPDVVGAGREVIHTWLARGGCVPGIQLKLDGPRGNREGIGSKIRIDRGDREFWRWMAPATTSATNAPVLYIGLAGLPSARQIEVTWSDGKVSTVGPVMAGEVVISHPDR